MLRHLNGQVTKISFNSFEDETLLLTVKNALEQSFNSFEDET